MLLLLVVLVLIMLVIKALLLSGDVASRVNASCVLELVLVLDDNSGGDGGSKSDESSFKVV